MTIPLHSISSGKVDYMENSIKLSIIVPVYKTEQYLRKCLSSILDQDVDKSQYEVIIVNDGSPDNSQIIIDEYCAKYDNVSCLVQTNQGLSMARNNGVEQAKGEYIWFIDSDDWVEDGSISKILEECRTLPDVISITYVGDDRNTMSPTSYSTTGIEIMSRPRRFVYGMVFYILRQEFIKTHNLSIYPGVYHEDAEFTPRMLYFAKKIRVIPEPLYYMYVNSDSISRSVNPKKSYDLLVISNNLYRFKEDVVVEPLLHKTFAKLIAIAINTALANIVKCDNCEQQRFNKAMYEKRFLLSELRKSSLKYQIEYVLFKLFPKHYVEIYKMLKRI